MKEAYVMEDVHPKTEPTPEDLGFFKQIMALKLAIDERHEKHISDIRQAILFAAEHGFDCELKIPLPPNATEQMQQAAHLLRILLGGH